jgi:RNA polymerase sigma factor (sigma-70 family)
MIAAASGAVAVTKAIDAIVRNDRGRLIAALIARLRSFQLAEDALQDAMISAVSHWTRNGVPASPQGWLLRAAYRKAIDRIRQDRSEARKVDALRPLTGGEAQEDAEDFPDDRLKLIFTCCHPALEQKSRVALTLRSVCGLTTGEIAALFLDAEPTMGQRLSRAKGKIAAAGIPYVVPGPEAWADRLQSVLAVIYLIFTTGYAAGPAQGHPLADEAIYLCRLLDELRPDDAEIEGCLALLLITHARRAARVDQAGIVVLLADQDRGLWDAAMIAEGLALLNTAMHRRKPGPYQIKAAIAACHVGPGGSDWQQIVLLYESLLRHEFTPVVRLGWAVALAEAGRLETGLDVLATLKDDLAAYQPFHAALAELSWRAGRLVDAEAAYGEAIALAPGEAERAFLSRRLENLQRSSRHLP